MATVLIIAPDNLTVGEAKLWDWALGAMEDAFKDDDLMRNNPDMTTVEGSIT